MATAAEDIKSESSPTKPTKAARSALTELTSSASGRFWNFTTGALQFGAQIRHHEGQALGAFLSPAIVEAIAEGHVGVATESYQVARSYMIRLEASDLSGESLIRLASVTKLSPQAFHDGFTPVVLSTVSVPLHDSNLEAV